MFRVGTLINQDQRSIAAMTGSERHHISRDVTGVVALDVPYERGNDLVKRFSHPFYSGKYASTSESIFMNLQVIDPLHQSEYTADALMDEPKIQTAASKKRSEKKKRAEAGSSQAVEGFTSLYYQHRSKQIMNKYAAMLRLAQCHYVVMQDDYYGSNMGMWQLPDDLNRFDDRDHEFVLVSGLNQFQKEAKVNDDTRRATTRRQETLRAAIDSAQEVRRIARQFSMLTVDASQGNIQSAENLDIEELGNHREVLRVVAKDMALDTIPAIEHWTWMPSTADATLDDSLAENVQGSINRFLVDFTHSTFTSTQGETPTFESMSLQGRNHSLSVSNGGRSWDGHFRSIHTTKSFRRAG